MKISYAVVAAIAVLVTLLFVFLWSSGKKKKPCYRCGGDAKMEYMSLHYCEICHTVVLRMLPIVGFGGMPGFPGAPGHTEFLPLSRKKEEIDG